MDSFSILIVVSTLITGFSIPTLDQAQLGLTRVIMTLVFSLEVSSTRSLALESAGDIQRVCGLPQFFSLIGTVTYFRRSKFIDSFAFGRARVSALKTFAQQTLSFMFPRRT